MPSWPREATPARASEPEARALRRETRAGALAFLAAFATLFAQVAVHRIVSAKMLNNYAFFILSLTMLGFAASGAWLSRRPQGDSLRAELLGRGAMLFGLGLVVATALFYPAPSVEDRVISSRSDFLLAFLSCLPLALLYAAAFAGSGLILGLLLSSPTLRTPRVYFMDLVGSALGAFAVIPAVSALGAERAAVAAGLLLLLGAAALFPPRARRERVAFAATSVVLALALTAPDAVFRLRYPKASPLGRTQEGDARYVLEHVAWDPIARIEVSRTAPPDPDHTPWPALFGPDREMLTRFRLLLTQNNNAYTYAPEYRGDLQPLRGLDQTIYAAAYQASLVARPRAAAIGVGGGIDILTALLHESQAVTGIEINAATLNILRRTYREHFRSWVDDPRVTLVHDEGRHYLASHPERFDVLQLSGVDSASGTPGAAHVFSENYLYTDEALDLYLSRLAENGLLCFIRPEPVPARDMLRLLLTAAAALRRQGVARPADHLVVVAARNAQLVAILVQRRPFSAEQVVRVGTWATRNPYLTLAAAPGFFPARPNVYDSFLRVPAGRDLATALRAYPYDVGPVTDDRPFFFRTTRWAHVWPGQGADPGPPAFELGLLSLLLVAAAAALALVYLPLRSLRRPPDRRSRTVRHALYFGGIGLGYMAVELAFIQKFGLLLGHPNHALTVVLASLLLASGLGSLVSEGLVRRLGGQMRFVSYAVAVLLLAEVVWFFPRLGSWFGYPFATRVLLVVGLVVPVGFLLGAYFPLGLSRLKRDAPELVPWAWGLNGMASVVAPVLSVAVSVTAGISALLVAAVPIYLIAGFAAAGTRDEAGPA